MSAAVATMLATKGVRFWRICPPDGCEGTSPPVLQRDAYHFSRGPERAGPRNHRRFRCDFESHASWDEVAIVHLESPCARPLACGRRGARAGLRMAQGSEAATGSEAAAREQVAHRDRADDAAVAVDDREPLEIAVPEPRRDLGERHRRRERLDRPIDDVGGDDHPEERAVADRPLERVEPDDAEQLSLRGRD